MLVVLLCCDIDFVFAMTQSKHTNKSVGSCNLEIKTLILYFTFYLACMGVCLCVFFLYLSFCVFQCEEYYIHNFLYRFAGCCWINLNNGGGSWSIRVKGSLAP